MKRIMEIGKIYHLRNYEIAKESKVILTRWDEYVVRVRGYQDGRKDCVKVTILAKTIKGNWNHPDHLGTPDDPERIWEGRLRRRELNDDLRLIYVGKNRFEDGMTWKPFDEKDLPIYVNWLYCTDELKNILAKAA